MTPGLSSALWLLLPLLLFTVGVVGVGLTQSNFLRLLVALELLLLGVNLNFILFATFFTAVWGQVFALLIVAVGAAEAAIGLAILIALYRVRGTIALRYFRLLRG
jgi:NADH-quinone oxidoreductase subunit K